MLLLNKEPEKYVIASFPEDVKRLNILISEKVKNQLNQVIDDEGMHLILDLTNITFIDSSGFGSLVTVFNHAKNRDVLFTLCNVSPETMELVKVTKLDQVFDIKADLPSVFESIN